jgi:hypothetical protein
MGMYDELIGHCRCGFCGSINEIKDQTKLLAYDDRSLVTYMVGDTIKLDDGEYTQLSGVREAVFVCKLCDNKNKYTIEVVNSKLNSFKANIQPDEIKKQTWDIINEQREIEQKRYWEECMKLKKRNDEMK